MKSLGCALAVLLSSSALMSCASGSSPGRASPALQVYQPRVLRLAAGQSVPTRDGTYQPQRDEVWHSAAAYEQLEREVLTLNAALAQERNRR